MEGSKTHFFREVGVMFGRTIRHITRSVDTIITVTIMPIAIMLLFVYVLGGAINTGSDNYVNYLLPGILLMAIATASSYTAYRLFMDKTKGIFDRFNSMPIAPSSPLWGHVLTSVVSTGISLLIIVIIALFMGFKPRANILEWFCVVGILALFTLCLTWIALIAGLGAKTADGAGAYSYPIMFLPFVSSAFVPTETMPYALRVFAENQPVTFIVDGIRSLLNGEAVSADVWYAVLWCVGILVVAFLLAMWVYKRKITKA